MEPWGFEPQIPPCHGGVIPFHYGPVRPSAPGHSRPPAIRRLSLAPGGEVSTCGFESSHAYDFCMLEGPYPVPPDQAVLLQARLSEARAWCLLKFNPDDPALSLRSPDLKPAREFTNEIQGPNGRTKLEWL